MIERICHIDNELEDSIFLFGARQTGKSTFLRQKSHRRLSAYIDVYLKEEIKEEALVRNLNTFQRFLEVAALTDGEMINNNNIAQDFEHLVIQELRAWLSYKESMEQLSYWKAYTGQEVDAVIGDARVAIEIKSVEEVLPRHLKGLKTFASDYPESKLLIVSLDPINRKMGDVECIYIIDFFRRLWSEGI